MKFLKIITISAKSGTVTRRYPLEEPLLTEEFRGRIEIDPSKCVGCGACARICPSKALSVVSEGDTIIIRYFVGRCIFCGMCVDTCPQQAIKITREFELATPRIDDLFVDIEHEAAICRCGKAFLPKKLVEAISSGLEKPIGELIQLCPECRRIATVKRLAMRFLGVPR